MQHINIFVSSTFNDMMNERDILKNYVQPELSSYFREKGIEIQLIDLRWGVVAENNEEISVEQKILKCCIDVIDVCKPFFIGFIGHRYGWIPDVDKDVYQNLNNETPQSITYIEIQHGIHSSNNYSRSLIFKRSLESYNNVPDSEKDNYIDNSKSNNEFLCCQFDKLQEGFIKANSFSNIINYTLDVIKPTKDECYSFAQIVIENLKRIITNEIGDLPNYNFKQSITKYLDNYISSNELCDLVFRKLGDSSHILLYGEKGIGKTSFALYLYNIITQFENVNCFLYSKGFNGSEESIFCENIRFWSEQLSQQTLEPHHEIAKEWSRFKYFHLDSKKYTYIIIDGYDKIDEIKQSQVLLFPIKYLIFIITSSSQLCNWEEMYKIQPLFIPGLKKDNVEEFIKNVISHINRKELPDSTYDTFKKYRQHNKYGYNPLDISITLSYILGLDKNDFTKINLESGTSKEKNIYEYIEKIIKEIPTEGIARSTYILNKLLSLFTIEELKPIIYLAFSKSGLSELQLKCLIRSYNHNSFFLIRNYLKAYIPIIGYKDKLKIYDDDLINAIKFKININSKAIYYELSLLNSPRKEEQFFYSLYGYNKKKTYDLYSELYMHEDSSHSDYNTLLLEYFEEDNNLKYFLSCMKRNCEDKNEKFLSNLVFVFLNSCVSHNKKLNHSSICKYIYNYIKRRKNLLNEDNNFFYLSYLCLFYGRELLNRNADRKKKILGKKYLIRALEYEEYTSLTTDFFKKEVNRLMKE